MEPTHARQACQKGGYAVSKVIMCSVRLSPQEYCYIQRKCEDANITHSDYIRAAIKGRDVHIIEGLSDMVIALNRIGNNINQIAKAVNYGLLSGAESDIRKAVNEISDLKKELFILSRQADICR